MRKMNGWFDTAPDTKRPGDLDDVLLVTSALSKDVLSGWYAAIGDRFFVYGPTGSRFAGATMHEASAVIFWRPWPKLPESA